MGTILKAGTQTLSVSLAPYYTMDYTIATASVPITINPATPRITWANPPAITYGTALSSTQLNATASVPGTFTYTPATGTVLSSGSQTLSLTFTPSDAADYTPVTSTVPISVAKVTPVVSWTAPPAIPYGTALSGTQLSATASVPGTFVYTPAAGILPALGTQILSVTFTPTDVIDYASVTKTVPITVVKGTPLLSWTAPAPISYGTALGSSQLNATASVPGALVYAPALGSILNSGTQTLVRHLHSRRHNRLQRRQGDHYVAGHSSHPDHQLARTDSNLVCDCAQRNPTERIRRVERRGR